MPRGAPQNMRPVRTKEEAKARGKAGGIASGEARRAKKTLRERLEALLSGNTDGGNTGDKVAAAMVEEAIKGNVKAFVAIRDTIGEKPKVDVTSSDGSMMPLPPLHIHFIEPEDDKD